MPSDSSFARAESGAVFRTRDPSRRSLFPRARVSGPTARSHDAGFQSVRDGPPASPDSCVGCTGDRAAPKQSPLRSEHISCRRDSTIKLIVDGGGLAMHLATIDNLRNPSPRIVTDTIIHSVLNACWCSVRLEMFKRNKAKKQIETACYGIFEGTLQEIGYAFLSLSPFILDILLNY